MITRILSGGVIAGVIACGGFGVWVADRAPWNHSEIDRAVGVAGILAFILAGTAIALLRRSWACIPLVGVCVIAGWLTKTALFEPYDASAIVLVPYFLLNILMAIVAGLALFITAVERERGSR